MTMANAVNYELTRMLNDENWGYLLALHNEFARSYVALHSRNALHELYETLGICHVAECTKRDLIRCILAMRNAGAEFTGLT